MTAVALDEIAPAFVTMAHEIVWAVAATVDGGGHPRTRVLHPIWEWDGDALSGWVATSPLSPKKAHIDRRPSVSCTYWAANHDTCTADCDVAWIDGADAKQALWTRFAEAPEPVGYDPSIIPPWTSAAAPSFGGLVLTPRFLRVMPGAALAGQADTLTWRRPA